FVPRLWRNRHRLWNRGRSSAAVALKCVAYLYGAIRDCFLGLCFCRRVGCEERVAAPFWAGTCPWSRAMDRTMGPKQGIADRLGRRAAPRIPPRKADRILGERSSEFRLPRSRDHRGLSNSVAHGKTRRLDGSIDSRIFDKTH